MKVKCTTEQWHCFTEGKEYEVLRKGYGKYYVNDDNGDQNELWNYECEVIDEAAQQSTQESTKKFKVGEIKQDENQRFDSVWDALDIYPNKDISYQEFLNAFDDKNVYVTISKGSVVIDIEGEGAYQQFECTTKQREQEVMKALIVLYGKREGEN